MSLREAARRAEQRWTLTELSKPTRYWLEAEMLDNRARRKPLETAVALMTNRRSEGQALLTAAEIAFVHGLDRRDEQALAVAVAASTLYLQQAAEGGTWLSRPTLHAIDLQRVALAGLLKRDNAWESIDVSIGGATVRVEADDGGDFTWRNGRFRDPSAAPGATSRPDGGPLLSEIRGLVPTHLVDIEGVRRQYRRTGVGTPAALILESPPDDDDMLFFPPQGIAVDATAVARAAWTSNDMCVVGVRMADPEHHETTPIGSAELPLAADFNVAFGVMAGRVNLRMSSLALMLRPNRGQQRTGIYLLAPYDPDKIPVLLVHGLKSSPLAWHETVAAIQGDPALRNRYQVFTFFYPTGAPFLLSASRLRASLANARRDLNPDGDQEAWNRTVVIAHSMGGLLAQTLAKEGGDALWHNVFHERPFEELSPPGVVKDTLERVVYFEPQPEVRRMILIAVPLRGSPLAKRWFATLGSWLVRPDKEVRIAGDWLTLPENREGLNDFVNSFTGGLVTGIGDLSPNSPAIQHMAGEPFCEGVSHHVIVGDADAAWPEGSDGVVPHASSRLESADSTLVVSGAGHDVLDHPRAVDEVIRILRLHLSELDSTD